MPVKLTRKVLCGIATKRSSGIDIADKNPFFTVGAAYRELHQVRTFPHTIVASISLPEATFIRPCFQIGRSINLHLLSGSQNHHPSTRLCMPKYVRISKIGNIGSDNRVARILLKGTPVINTVSHTLGLTGTGRGIKGHNSAFSEACCIVHVYHTTAAKDGAQCIWYERFTFKRPM